MRKVNQFIVHFMNIIKLFTAWSVVLAISSFFSRLMWVYRDHLLASNFGAWIELDIYFAAFRIPDLIYSLLVFSTIAVVFLPHYLKVKKKYGQEKANIITSRVLNLLVLTIWLISLFIAIFANKIINFYVYWFSLEAKEMVVSLMRIMLLSPIFFAISSVAISVQNASHKFFTQALAPIFYNAWIIFSILFLVEKYWIIALSWWVLLWAILQALIQIPSLFKEWFRWIPVFKVNHEIKKMTKIALPRILSIGIYQISLTIDTFIAAWLMIWSISAINLAANIASFPLWMIVVSISITTFVYLSKQSEDNENFLKTLELNIKKTIYWLLPALFWLFALSWPIINFLFLYWKFSQANALLTQNILSFLLLSIWFQWFVPLLNRAYFAKWNTIIPLYASLIAMLTNIISSFLLSKIYWSVWIAMWTAIWMFVYCLILIWFTKRDFWNFLPIKFILKTLVISVLMYLILSYISSQINNLTYFIQIIILWTIWTFFYLWINWFKIIK